MRKQGNNWLEASVKVLTTLMGMASFVIAVGRMILELDTVSLLRLIASLMIGACLLLILVLYHAISNSRR